MTSEVVAEDSVLYSRIKINLLDDDDTDIESEKVRGSIYAGEDECTEADCFSDISEFIKTFGGSV